VYQKYFPILDNNQSVSNFDEKASDNPDIPLGDNGSMNNTSDINDCISIDSEIQCLIFKRRIIIAYT
jgi:hypothetical protein